MTNVTFKIDPQTKQLDPVWNVLPNTFKLRLDGLIGLAQKAKDDEEKRESFKNISAVHLLARTYLPVPPEDTHPLEGADATDYWIDYIFTAASRDKETGKKEK